MTSQYEAVPKVAHLYRFDINRNHKLFLLDLSIDHSLKSSVIRKYILTETKSKNLAHAKGLWQLKLSLRQLLLTASHPTSMMTKCRVMESVIAPRSHILFHGGISTSDWFSDML